MHLPTENRDRYIALLNGVIDDCMCDLSGNDLKVLLYILNHTFGYGKTTDSIALSQFQYGITKRDGTWLDRGTGLSKNTILKSINSLVKHDILIKHPVRVERKLFRPSIFEFNPIFLEMLTGSAEIGHTVSANSEHTRNLLLRENSIEDQSIKQRGGEANGTDI